VALKRNSIAALAVAAVLLTGCGGQNVEETPTTVDTAPPSVPTQLTGSSWHSQITISWSPNATDTDFAGFKVYRLSGTRVLDLTEEPQGENMYLDVNPALGYNTYQVASVDLSGNESARASIEVYLDPDYGAYHPDQP